MHNTMDLLASRLFVGDKQYDFAVMITLWVLFFAAVGCVFVLPAYGRFASNKMGISLDGRVGWWLMELPASVVFVYFYFVVGGSQSHEPVPMLCAILWCIHYTNRGWLFPLLTRVSQETKNKTFSISVISFGMVFTSLHGYLNAQWFAEHGKHLNNAWLSSPQFIVGILLYETGFWLTIHSEHIVRRLRDPDPTKPNAPIPRYRIPRGGLFEFVTNATYTAELLAWTGFMVFTAGPGGLIILCISLINLVPRAFATHTWYQEKFGAEYTALRRKVLIPLVL